MIPASFKIAYTSRRPFDDGPATIRFPVNDPANIAHVLGGDYFSFMTLRRLSRRQLQRKLAPYDLVFVPMDLRDLATVEKISAACAGRLATYSEGNVADYQLHEPAGQVTFLQIINQAAVNFLYWEKYVPFYRTLTTRPVCYLPYPYFHEDASQFSMPYAQRASSVTLPSGLAGQTRNGLASLAVAKQLLRDKDVERVECWLHAGMFSDDAAAVQQYLLDTPWRQSKRAPNWRKWLARTGIDYRTLLRASKRLRKGEDLPPPPLLELDGLTLYRRRTWLHYLPRMAATRLVVDMNNRETVGRNALDCAAVGLPCVSTNRSDMQEKLFPDTTLEDCWDIAGAVALCRRLLRDRNFYDSVTATAAGALAQFGPQAFQRRLAEILAEYPSILRREGEHG